MVIITSWGGVAMAYVREFFRAGFELAINRGIDWASSTQPEPADIPPDNERLEEFGGLILSSAAALRYPKGSKPARIDHRTVWHKPYGQSITRTLTISMEVNHTKIFYYWPYSVSKAIDLHIAKDLKEGLYELLKLKLWFCKEALTLWTFLMNETYANTKDGTVEKLKTCIETLQNLLDDPQIKPLLESPKEPPAQDVGNAPPEKNEEDKKALVQGADPNPEKVVNEEGPKEKLPEEEPVAKINPQVNSKLDEKQSNCADKITALWRDLEYLRTIKKYFDDADSVPMTERESNKLFQSSMDNIFGAITYKDAKYDNILKERLII